MELLGLLLELLLGLLLGLLLELLLRLLLCFDLELWEGYTNTKVRSLGGLGCS